MAPIKKVASTMQKKSNQNQIKFKLDNARSGYPVSRARGSCIMRL